MSKIGVEMEGEKQPLLAMRGITKSFGGLRALTDVDLTLQEGQILAIVGDNGAGKSTLIKILTGVYQPDAGEIFINGAKVEMSSRRESIKAGVNAVYQNLGLVDALPAPANVFLGNEPVRRILGIPFLDNRRMREETERILLENTGVRLEDTSVPTLNLSGGQRQAVAIARAVIVADLKVLVMDEPTAALGPEETRNTLELIRAVRDRGIAVIVISHNLEHVFAVADRVLVMRAGRAIGEVDTAGSSGTEVLGMIVGSAVVTAPLTKTSAQGAQQ
ncbi:MAG: ATP-binding cassette domain-containing protein [Burkholderiaceae bacterium]|nr:ATP-binding cassette domain-containing protein [Burkholderiaceae bacterium]